MNYDDIINLPHHVSKNHMQMSIHDRAAQFAPFSALTGYEEVINETNQIVEKARGTEKEISYVSELFSRGNSGSAGGRQ